FFFQAEDGIRDFHVTGVQTCALPIWPQGLLREYLSRAQQPDFRALPAVRHLPKERLPGSPSSPSPPQARIGQAFQNALAGRRPRSEERRVGKECRSRWSTDHSEETRQ